MGTYIEVSAAIFLVHLFRALTVIVFFVMTENLQESSQTKNRIYNSQKIIISKGGTR